MIEPASAVGWSSSCPPCSWRAGASSLPTLLGSHSSLHSSLGEVFHHPCEGLPVSARCLAPGTAR